MNKKIKKDIANWLKDKDGPDICPFQGSIQGSKFTAGVDRCEEICAKWFPKVKAQLEEKNYSTCFKCPCQSYPVKYVRKVAKELIKEKK